MKDWTIHIGLPKCGSTWLQMRVFPALHDVDYVGKLYTDTPWNQVVRKITRQPGLDFPESEVAAWLRTEETGLQRPFQLLSSEDFGGNPLQLWSDSRRTADRLGKLFPGAKILLVVRRHDSLIESFYKQYVQIGGTLSLEGFLTQRTPLHGLDYAALRFDRLAAYFSQVFGAERVFVLPFEMMGRDHQLFADEVCRVIGCRAVTLKKEEMAHVRTGFSVRYCAIVRRLNLLGRNNYSPVGLFDRPSSAEKIGFRSPYHLGRHVADALDRLFPLRPLMNAAQRGEIAEYYAESDAALVQRFPQLAEFGYGRGAATAPAG